MKMIMFFQKKTLWLLLFAMILPVLVMADVDGSADLQGLLSSLSVPAMLRFTAAMLIGCVMAPANQNVIEHLLSLIPNLPGFVKALIPHVLHYLAAKVAIGVGVDPTQAWTAAVTLSGATAAYNGTGLAASVSNEPKVV